MLYLYIFNKVYIRRFGILDTFAAYIRFRKQIQFFNAHPQVYGLKSISVLFLIYYTSLYYSHYCLETYFGHYSYIFIYRHLRQMDRYCSLLHTRTRSSERVSSRSKTSRFLTSVTKYKNVIQSREFC